MIQQLFLLSSIASVDAFLTPPSSLIAPNTVNSSWQSKPLLAPLHADAEGGDGAAAEEGAEDHEVKGSLPTEDQADILNSPAFLTRKVEVLQSDIAALEKEIEEANVVYTAGKEEWGTKFDMLNKESQGIQERMSKQGNKGTETATFEVAEKFIGILDSYDRAFAAVEAATNEEVEIVNAYQNSYDMILESFAGLNVTKIETLGVEFNYTMHQAMMQMPSDEYEEGIVCQEFASGWKVGEEKCIRPAMVVVAA